MDTRSDSAQPGRVFSYFVIIVYFVVIVGDMTNSSKSQWAACLCFVVRTERHFLFTNVISHGEVHSDDSHAGHQWLWWTSWRLKSPVTRLFFSFVSQYKMINALHFKNLCRIPGHVIQAKNMGVPNKIQPTPHHHYHHLPLTHWGRDKMAAISQTTFSNEFSWMIMYEYRLKCHWSLFIMVQLTISQHWFR